MKTNNEAKEVAKGIILRMIVDIVMGALMIVPPAVMVGMLIVTWNPLWILAFVVECFLVASIIYECYFVKTAFCTRYEKYYEILVKGIESLE